MILMSIYKGQLQGGKGAKKFGQCPKENIFFAGDAPLVMIRDEIELLNCYFSVAVSLLANTLGTQGGS